jgi:large conductance mechanosensitive channel
MMKDFKDFIFRGNVVDLAVAVVLGAAFNSVIQSLVKDFVTPLITGFMGKGALLQGKLVIAHRFTFNWGDFFSVLISFVIEAFIIFIFIVQPLNKLNARRNKTAEAKTKKCPECISEVPIKASRCAFCTIKLS